MTVAKVVQADPDNRPQFGLINVLKAGAAQLIVLHHLAFYGPMSDHVQPMWPALIDWLGDSARIAVQVFLVIGGFLAAKSLAPAGLPGLAPSPAAGDLAPLRQAGAALYRRHPDRGAGQCAGRQRDDPRLDFGAGQRRPDGRPCAAAAWRARLRIAVGRRLVCGDRLPAVCAGGAGVLGAAVLPAERRLPWLVPAWSPRRGRCRCCTSISMPTGTTGRRISSAAMAWACWPGGPATRAARPAP